MSRARDVPLIGRLLSIEHVSDRPIGPEPYPYRTILRPLPGSWIVPRDTEVARARVIIGGFVDAPGIGFKSAKPVRKADRYEQLLPIFCGQFGENVLAVGR